MQFRTLFALAYWALALCTALVIDYSYVNSSIGWVSLHRRVITSKLILL